MSRCESPAVTEPRIFPGRAAGMAALWAMSAASALLMQRCPFAAVTHVPCPGCGMTRAMHALLDGHVVASLAWHPLMIPTVVAQLALAAASIVFTYRRGHPLALWTTRAGRAVLATNIVVGVLVVLLWLVRAAGMLGGPVTIVSRGVANERTSG